MEKKKRRWGDRKDGTLIRELDSVHLVMPMVYLNRCDNEAFIQESIDLANLTAFIKKKNENETDFPYTWFHAIVTALIKTITLRPKMNRFIANKNYYQRNEVTAAFIVKKRFTDNGEESVAVIHGKEDSTLSSIHEELRRQIFDCRDENKADTTSRSLNPLKRLPRWLVKFIACILRFLDVHGRVPDMFSATDPYHASCVISNLGSLKLKCGYHHLTNWGTCSFFAVVGEKSVRPVFFEDGHYEMREVLDLGLTVDERIADGYYFSKTVHLLKALLEHPELLETPAGMPVDEKYL